MSNAEFQQRSRRSRRMCTSCYERKARFATTGPSGLPSSHTVLSVFPIRGHGAARCCRRMRHSRSRNILGCRATVNVEMMRWLLDAIPQDWTNWRDRWGYGHAVRAGLATAALGALTLSPVCD